MPTLSDSFDPEVFLRDYWQKKPLLIKGLFRQFEDLLSPEELAGLACESIVESRLIEGSVTQNPVDKRIAADLKLTHGPIDEQHFPQLPEQDWTVLVQSVDQWAEEVNELKNCFDFIPNWRIEDVMISFAAPGGTVGPHFDYYDVFLLQGGGCRRWQVGERCSSNTATVDQAGLSLLAEFTTIDSYDLEPGDALYLPPRFAHWGTALEAGLCYSIGLRSPSLAEMLEGFSDAMIARADPELRFEDPQPQIPAHPASIDSSMLDTAHAQLLSALAGRDDFDRWFGCQVTQPRYPESIHAPDEEYSLEDLAGALEAGESLLRHPGSRFAQMSLSSGNVLCFVDGACHELGSEDAQLIAKLTHPDTREYGKLFRQCSSTSGQQLLLQLLNQGSLVLDAE